MKDNKNKENTKNRNNKKDKDRNKKVLLWIIIVALSLVIFGTVVYTVIKERKDEDVIPEDQISYTDLIKQINDGNVEKIKMTVGSTTIKVNLKEQEEPKTAIVPSTQAFIELVQEKVQDGNEITLIQEKPSVFLSIADKAFSILPTILMLVLLVLLIQMQGLGDKGKVYEADEDAEYDEEYTIDLSTLRPTVAFPHLPENTRTIDEVGDVKIDQVVIGSCTNGRIEDMRTAAKILEGREVAKGVRCIVFPATQAIYLQCIEEGIMTTFIKAGCAVSTPTCGPCLGGHMGILAKGERAVATTNRNFVGRMGDPESEVYLASPAVAAASAITGKISGPEELGL